ncbi:MAG: T9SS type A sorting domain-containing protein [Bacteroidetes bacterium]|nr:T9SS type A sorting domain-containing protein [Bacteroidota bacterium]
MKKRILVLLLFFVGVLQAQQVAFSISEQEKNHFIARQQAPASCAISNTYDVTYYRFCWNTNPSINYISGSVTMFFIPQTPIDSLQMDASISLSIDSVWYHHTRTPFSQQTGDVLQIKFASTLSAPDSLTVFYHGVPQATGMGSFKQSTHGSNNSPVIWTLSEPYGARDWFPCKMTLNDKADSIDTYITVPLGNKAAGNGVLKQIIPQGTNQTYHWKHKHPIAAYLIAQAVTNYASYEDTVPLQLGKLPVLYYVYPEDSLASRQTDGALLKAIHYYDSLFVPYSFSDEKYGHAQFGWGGGMEHQTMSFVGSFDILLLAHELAHQWFGDRITCGTWRDIWLNEGFAVYCSALSLTMLQGKGYFDTWKTATINSIVSAPDGSVYVDDTTNVARIFDGRLTYNKGAYLLHMLRCMLGDSLFFSGIRSYLNDLGLAYSFAQTSKLQQHLESVSGISLNTFFTQWFYGQGYPSYLLLYNQDANNHMKITLNQSTSHPSVSFFSMPVPVRFKGQNKDTTIVLNHTQSGQVFNFNFSFQVDSIFLDPQLSLISAKNKVMNEYAYLRSLQKVIAYPNPSSTQINVEVNNFSTFPQSVELYNVLGQKILSFTPAENHFSIPVQEYAAGTYYLKIISETHVYTQKIIKE